MIKIMRERARLELERQMRPYRRRGRIPVRGGWLRAVRLALGIAAEQIARVMGFTPKMVFYMERAELKGTIHSTGWEAGAGDGVRPGVWLVPCTSRWRIGRWSW